MKAVKILGIIAVLTLLLFFGVGFLLPSQVSVVRSRYVDAPREVVFEEVNTMRYWEDWSPWHSIDPEMKLYYTGPDKGVGAGYNWSSRDEAVGQGKLTVIDSEPFGEISTTMEFVDGKDTYLSDIEYVFEEEDIGTLCTWTMKTDMGDSPVGRWMGLFMDSMVGKDFEKGLINIERSAQLREKG